VNETGQAYLVETIKSLRGLKSTAEKAIAQISDEEMHYYPDAESNNVAILMKHMAGNMLSRFTDFLSTDGEKEWRNRDGEFIDEGRNREELFELWNRGWNLLIKTLTDLKDEDLHKTVIIRGEDYTVMRALQRQLVHYAYHTGQIVYLCKHIRSTAFQSLSIPRKKE
jgi:uncharacterized damage-inducible protein DinB